MRILIKKVTIIDPRSSLNNEVKDVFIVDGIIEEIGNDLKVDYTQLIAEENLHISPGLFDFRATFGEPGLETKEDFKSGTKAAQLGGFTGVAITPNTVPTISNRNTVEYIVNKASNSIVNVYPMGSVSKDIEGKPDKNDVWIYMVDTNNTSQRCYVDVPGASKKRQIISGDFMLIDVNKTAPTELSDIQISFSS